MLVSEETQMSEENYEVKYDDVYIQTRSSSIGDKWYYNTGTSLPQLPNYSKYNLVNYLAKGDIFYEKKGGSGITGHIAIVEGRFYDNNKKKYYYRIIEAIDCGVSRSVLDDDRVDDKGVQIYRISGATMEQKNNALELMNQV